MTHGIFLWILFELAPLKPCTSLNYGAIIPCVFCSSGNDLSWDGMGLPLQTRMWENQHPKKACGIQEDRSRTLFSVLRTLYG